MKVCTLSLEIPELAYIKAAAPCISLVAVVVVVLSTGAGAVLPVTGAGCT